MAIPSYRLKMLRAVEQVRVLLTTVERWAADQPCYVVAQTDVKSRKNSLSFHVLRQPDDPTIPLLVGEAAHSFRQALDHLSYQLAVTISGTDPPPNEATAMFPIYTQDSAQLDSGLPSKIAPKESLPPDLYAILDGLQPYQGGDNEYLAALHLLDNTDKHRFLPITAGVTDIASLHIETIEYSWIDGPRLGATEDGTTFMEWIPLPGSEVKMNLQFAPGIAFGKSSPVAPGQPVSVVFERILLLVRRAIDECEPFIIGN